MLIALARGGVRRLRAGWRRLRPTSWGNMRRCTPVSRHFGFDRGQVIDRRYIEQFLAHHRRDIRGHVLEIGGRQYTTLFGEDIARSDVLHAVPGNPEATLVGDLATGAGVPTAAFTCIILTQVLPFIYDVSAAVRHVHDVLRPGGVALVTVPGICQISRYDMEQWGDFWRFTDLSARRLFADAFGADNVTTTTYGNVLAACAFLHGIAVHELSEDELDYHDPDYQVVIGLRAVKKPQHGVR